MQLNQSLEPIIGYDVFLYNTLKNIIIHFRPLTRQQPILLPGEENRRTSEIPSGVSSTTPTVTCPPTTGEKFAI